MRDKIVKSANAVRDFSLMSGERQFAADVKDIRRDHVNRYVFGLKHIRQIGFGLDIFCGNGYGSYMASQKGHHILGVDASQEAIIMANKNYSADEVYFSCKRWPFSIPKRTFDFCFCLESIEHVEDGEALISAIYDSLKPGGLLILSTPNEDLMPFSPKQHRFHTRHYTQEETFALLRKKDLKMTAWGGQTVYYIKDGEYKILEQDAEVISDKAGQFLITVARK